LLRILMWGGERIESREWRVVKALGRVGETGLRHLGAGMSRVRPPAKPARIASVA